MRMVVLGGVELRVSEHAQERWRQRVKPMLGKRDALADVCRVLTLAGEVSPRPAWALMPRPVDVWVNVGDSITFPVLNRTLLTCLTRAEPGDEARERRQRERKRADPDGYGPKSRKQHGKVKRGERARARRRLEGV